MNIRLLLTSTLTMTASCMIAQSFHYPKAPQDNTVDTYFGTQIADPYRPLEDDNSAETEHWVTAENALTRHYLDQLQATWHVVCLQKQRLAEPKCAL